MVSLREVLRQVLQEYVFVFDLRTNQQGVLAMLFREHLGSYNDVSLDFGRYNGITMNTVSSSDVRFSIGENLRVELTLSPGQICTLAVLIDHGRERGIARCASAKSPSDLLLVDQIRHIGRLMRRVISLVGEGKRRLGGGDKAVVPFGDYQCLTGFSRELIAINGVARR